MESASALRDIYVPDFLSTLVLNHLSAVVYKCSKFCVQQHTYIQYNPYPSP